MKKLTNLLLAAMLMFAFVACDSSQTTEETTEEVVEEVVETVEETVEEVADSVTAE
jgi:hypothetical protein